MNDAHKLEKEISRLKSAIEELSVLNELALAVGASTDVHQVLDTIVQKAVKAVRAEQGSLMLVTQKQDNPLQTLIRKEDFSGTMPAYRVGSNITGWVLKNRSALRIEDLAKDARFRCTEEECRALRSVLCVPVWQQAKIIGVLMVTNKKTGEPFSDGDLRLLSIIAAQSGQLIRNARLQEEAVEKKRLQHELDLARNIQQSLLPAKDPRLKGLDITGYFSPADAVSGDYYDYITLDEHRLAIVIADVSGHGPSAALVMTLLKGVVHSLAIESGPISHWMRGINRIISKIIPDEVFITMQLLLFDIPQKRLTFCNAGHNPPLYYNSASQECSPLELPGCALNVLPDFDYGIKEIPLNRGDFIFIYTDGLAEAFNKNNEEFGQQRVMEIISQNGTTSSQKMMEHIRTAVFTFMAGNRQADDMACVGVKIL